jgi:hypothetical protein
VGFSEPKVEHVVYPAVRLMFAPPRALATDGTLLQIADLHELYKVSKDSTASYYILEVVVVVAVVVVVVVVLGVCVCVCVCVCRFFNGLCVCVCVCVCVVDLFL